MQEIWGDGTDWWIELGASSKGLIVGACFSFVLVWIIRVLVVWRAWKALKVVRSRSNKFYKFDLNI